MTRTRRTAMTLAVAAAVVAAPAAALGHGGGHGGPGGGPDRGAAGHRGHDARTCTVPEAQRLTTATSDALARLRTRLDAAVTAGRITRDRADARFARAVTRLSVARIVADARIAPVLTLLGMTHEELRDAREDGATVREILSDRGVTRARYRAAVREGRAAARAALDAVCPTDDDPAAPAAAA